VKVEAAGRADSAEFEVRPNPRGHATPEDLAAQFDLLAAIRDRLSETHLAVLQLRDAKAQATELGERAARLGRGDALQKRAKELAAKLDAIERELINPDIQAPLDGLNYPPRFDHEWTYLAGLVAGADRRPTVAERQRYEELRTQLAAIQSRIKVVMDTDVAQFNQAVAALNIPPVAPAPRIDR
jgi:hypothetical protein